MTDEECDNEILIRNGNQRMIRINDDAAFLNVKHIDVTTSKDVNIARQQDHGDREATSDLNSDEQTNFTDLQRCETHKQLRSSILICCRCQVLQCS